MAARADDPSGPPAASCSGRPAVGVLSPRGSLSGCILQRTVIYVSGAEPLCTALSLTCEVHP